MRSLVLRLGLLSSLLLMGCAIRQTYPGAWPRVDPTRIEGCPQIAGDYLSSGVMADPLLALSSLSELLLDQPAPGAIIRIAQYGSDSLAVTAWQMDSPGTRQVFCRAKGNLSCAPAGLGLSCGWGSPGTGGLALGVARRTVYLAKATDGSLMAQSVEFSIGFLWFIPMIATMRSWHRFSPPTFPPLPPPEGEPPITE